MSELMKKERDKHFYKYKDAKITLYVSGIKADDIVASFEEYHIIGIMDAYPVIESVYGKPLLTFEAAMQAQVEIIIIISPINFYEIIRKRLSRFCHQYNIKLFTLEGVKLALDEEFLPELCHPAFWLKEEELRQKIRCHKIIYIPIHQILWTILQEGENAEKGKGKNSLEKRIFPREAMISLCCEIWKSGKKLILVNNTGLDKSLVNETLKKIGVLEYTALYSMEEINKYCLIENEDSLFIGNPDKIKKGEAVTWQFDIGKIYSVRELFQHSVYSNKLLKKNEVTPYSRLKKDLFCARMFDSPFCLIEENGKGVIENAKDIGFCIVAPYVCDFVIWFLKKVKHDRIDHILFGARDGYLMERLYDLAVEKLGLKEMPDRTYLYISRQACLVNGIKEDKDILGALRPSFSGGMEDLLINRFLIEPTDVELYNYEKMEDKEAYILRHRKKILEKAAECRRHYEAYIKKMNLEKFKKIAFFDLAASGSCQKYLQKMMDTPLRGYYFYRIESEDKEKRELDIKAFGEKLPSVEANMLFMETVFSSPEGTFQRIGSDGQIITIKDSRTEGQKRYCEEIQQGILEYCGLVFDIIGKLEDCYEEELQDDFLDYLYKGYTVINEKEFRKYIQVDEFQYECFDVGNLYRW